LDSELRRLRLPLTLSPQYASEVLPAITSWGKNLKDSALNNKYLGFLLRIKSELGEKLPQDDFWLLLMDNLAAEDREFQMNGSDHWGTYNTRDRQMALNLEWLNAVKYKKEKIIVWAANYHISKYSGHYPASDGFMNAAQTMGTVFTSDPGIADKTYILGFTSYEGSSGRLYHGEQYPVTPPRENSFENWVGKGYDYAFVDFKKFNSSHAEQKEFYMSGAVKGNWWHKNSEAHWNKIFDGVFFIRKMYPCEKVQ
jgi:erythromycin esterase-like protein